MEKDLEKASRCICAGYRTELLLSDVFSWVYICRTSVWQYTQKGEISFNIHIFSKKVTGVILPKLEEMPYFSYMALVNLVFFFAS